MPLAVILPYSNQWYPTEDWTLRKFHQTARAYLHANRPNALDYFLKLVLSGQALNDQGETIRVRLTPEVQTPHFTALANTVAVRDFDSLLGISHDLSFIRSFSIFPIPSFRDTLKKDNHLCKTIRQPVSHAHSLYSNIN